MTTRQVLENLGELRSGYHYRSARDLEPKDDPNYRAVQLGSLTEDNRINWDSLEPIHFDGDPKRYLLRDGDVLVPLRGMRVVATLVEQPPADAFVIGQWAILSPNPKLIDSRYLTCYLNHPRMQHRLAHLSRGSGISFLPMQEFSKVKVHVPPLMRQQQIARVAELRQQERKLVNQLEELKNTLINAATMQSAIEE